MERFIKRIIGPNPKEQGANEQQSKDLARRIRRNTIWIALAGVVGLILIFGAVGD